MDFKGQRVGALWQPVATCGGIILALKKKFRILEARIFDIRVLEARGLAGLAGLAGRRMEQRSLARSMLWRDRRIKIIIRRAFAQGVSDHQ